MGMTASVLGHMGPLSLFPYPLDDRKEVLGDNHKYKPKNRGMILGLGQNE